MTRILWAMAGVLLSTAMAAEPRYDASSMIETGATVLDVKEVARGSALEGVHVTVRTDADAQWDVFLGPAAYIKDFEVTFHKGESIHIVGSKVKVADTPTVLAREVRLGSTTLYLRDKNGTPYWSAPSKPAS